MTIVAQAGMLYTLRRWLGGLFAPRPPEPRLPNPLTEQRQQTRDIAKDNGAYLNLDNFLEDLDDKFMRLHNTKFPKYRGVSMGHAQILKHAGAFVMSRHARHPLWDLDPFVTHTPPDTVLCSYPADEDCILGDWIYLVRRPRLLEGVEIARRGEITYSLDILLSKSKHGPSIMSGIGYFALSGGALRELRYRARVDDRIDWRYSPIYDDDPMPGVSAAERRVSLATGVLNTMAWRNRHWRVVATDPAGFRVVATIPDNDAPRFFKKAERMGGKAFHAVVAHTRANGSNVRTHYRGSRFFRYGDYTISVEVPGRRQSK